MSDWDITILALAVLLFLTFWMRNADRVLDWLLKPRRKPPSTPQPAYMSWARGQAEQDPPTRRRVFFVRGQHISVTIPKGTTWTQGGRA